MGAADLWNDPKNAQKVIAELKVLRAQVEPLEGVIKDFEDAKVGYEMAKEAGDADLLNEVDESLFRLQARMAKVERQSLLSGKHDFRNYYAREIAMFALAGVSWFVTPMDLRTANSFSFGPIQEVAALFCGIFVTMIPATMLLEANGAALGIESPWQYFWATGMLSSFLDNAPTYVTFAAMACANVPSCTSAQDLGSLVASPEGTALLIPIALGAVFMGANSYIGNGPNFMVRAIAEENGYRMPSFFGYVGWACLVLLPVFALVTVLFLV